jgi:hypothetical protein
MRDFDIFHNPSHPEQSVYYIKPKRLHNPLVDVLVILGLAAVLLLTGYMHL